MSVGRMAAKDIRSLFSDKEVRLESKDSVGVGHVTRHHCSGL